MSIPNDFVQFRKEYPEGFLNRFPEGIQKALPEGIGHEFTKGVKKSCQKVLRENLQRLRWLCKVLNFFPEGNHKQFPKLLNKNPRMFIFQNYSQNVFTKNSGTLTLLKTVSPFNWLSFTLYFSLMQIYPFVGILYCLTVTLNYPSRLFRFSKFQGAYWTPDFQPCSSFSQDLIFSFPQSLSKH